VTAMRRRVDAFICAVNIQWDGSIPRGGVAPIIRWT